eukprot:4451394-Ditylum_brightwellii.AAC.1
MLVLKARYYSEVLGEDNIMDISFNIMKKDNPVVFAQYIKEYVVDALQRNSVYSTWANKLLKQNGRVVQRNRQTRELTWGKILDKEAIPPGIKKKISRNKRSAKNKKKEKCGIKIPNSTREALLLDKANKDNKWGEAIAKEIEALE